MSDNKFSKANLSREDAPIIDFGLSILSPRWTSEILIDLSGGPKRTTHLLRDLNGISAKTLCQRLRRLGELGLVSRTTYAEVPPRVEYTLTEKGQELTNVLSALKDLGKDLYHLAKNRLRLKPELKRAEAEDLEVAELCKELNYQTTASATVRENYPAL